MRDQPLAIPPARVALAIRDETVDCGRGIAVIQVDEPALRELLPIAPTRPVLALGGRAFRLATSGVSDATQIHASVLSEFGG